MSESSIDHEQLLEDLAALKGEFLLGNRQYPDLNYLRIFFNQSIERASFKDAVSTIVDSVAGSARGVGAVSSLFSWTPGESVHRFSVFYSLSREGIAGLKLLRTLAKSALKIAFDGLRVSTWEEVKKGEKVTHQPGGIMPMPWHLVTEKADLEHDWGHWIVYLGHEYKHPSMSVSSGPIDIYEEPGKPKETLMFLPNCHSVGKWNDGDGKPGESPGFKSLLKVVLAGGIEKVSLCEGGVFLASATAIDLLIRRVRERDGYRPPDPLAGQKGPIPPDAFQWDYRITVGPTPWKLLNLLWHKHRCEVSELELEVWGHELEDDGPLRAAINRANGALTEAGYTGSLSRSGDWVTLD
jgi:hypothetical protein